MNFDIVRAWKDEEYRLSLSDEERLSLPTNPVGEIELTDADLELVYGGNGGSDKKGGGGGNSHNCQSHAYICISNNCSHGCFTFAQIC